MNGSKTIQQLIELNDELENYFRNTIIPQLFVDANLILRKFTPPAMKQFSFTPEHIGRPMQEMVNHIRYSTIVENINSVIESGEIFEKEIQTTDRRWFQMNIIPYLIKKENRANGVIITFVDITDRMKVLKQLEKLNASHETFIYAVSHDLKAPLANIEGLVEQLKVTSAELMANCDEDNHEQEMIAKMLDSSVNRMRTILNELSEIAKIEGNYKEIAETVSFEAILNEVELTIKDRIVNSNASITYELGVATIETSPKNLRSILYNLLSNAINYQAPGRPPEIVVKTEEKEEYVMLSVKDNGLGIAEDKIDLLFAPYTRFTKDREGTGIGLYLIKKLVENTGGSISVNSKLNHGTEFVIYLKPIVQES
ncbi:PAS domain-containing protein [Microvirga sp. STS03]|nr:MULTISPECIES: ATP-binding protein [Pontibacter]MBR0571710.1 PAS domain-containing protein [Microvirga sp. STS03]